MLIFISLATGLLAHTRAFYLICTSPYELEQIYLSSMFLGFLLVIWSLYPYSFSLLSSSALSQFRTPSKYSFIRNSNLCLYSQLLDRSFSPLSSCTNLHKLSIYFWSMLLLLAFCKSLFSCLPNKINRIQPLHVL